MAQYGNGYGNGGANPYAQQASTGYPQSPQYDNGAAMGRDSYGGQNVEMESLAQNGSVPGQQADPNFILNSCRDIDYRIEATSSFITRLQTLRNRVGSELDQGTIARDLANISSESSVAFKSLINEISSLKRMPESGRQMEQYKAKEMEFEHAVRDQMRREYRIVNAEATDEEVNAATRQANTTLNAVRQRNEAIKKIERDIIEIAELFSEMENLVVQQEAAVVNIEMKGEEVVENMDKGVQQIDTAIVSARSRNRKKWYCLGIVVIIVAIIAIVLAVHFTSQSKSSDSNTTTKRSVDFVESNRLVIPGASFTETKIMVPGQQWSEDKAIVPVRTLRLWFESGRNFPHEGDRVRDTSEIMFV
ncbi:hypothetical protein DID88_009318 [Monilinia fructigena]|uniref:t-SNARE coiled-coil homology domain-containing protein n=1 Tax=Monilinia fructigena TaxID=38457 RepID=A0A395IHJ3_9HELO|nr:hypothetical protein DID88_009318 [Monilinia fructigena]